FTDHELKILEQHSTKSRDGSGVLVGIQRDEKDEFLIHDLVEGQQIVIGIGYDRKVVFGERPQLVQQTLDLLQTLAVFEGLQQVLCRHLKVLAPLLRYIRLIVYPARGFGNLFFQHQFISGHNQYIGDVVDLSGVVEHAAM